MSSPPSIEILQKPTLAINPSQSEVLEGPGEKCEWDDCHSIFSSLRELVNHLSEDHIKWKRPSYTCEWRGCARRGIAQQSRFALISHLRSHTGEKPYDCTHPECDKSFTRTDALVKHLRQQHGEAQGKDIASSSSSFHPNSHHITNNGTNHDRYFPTSEDKVRRPPSSVYKNIPIDRERDRGDRDRERVSITQQLKRRRSVSADSHKGFTSTSQSKRAKTLPGSISRSAKSSSVLHHRGRPVSLDRPSSHHSRRSSIRRDRQFSHSISDTETESEHGGGGGGHSNGHRGRTGSPRDIHAKYKLAKAKYLYISRENEMLTEEYESLRRKLRRLKIEKNVLLEAVYDMTKGAGNDDFNSSTVDSDIEGRPEDYDDEMDLEMAYMHTNSPIQPAAPAAPVQQPVKGKRGGRRPGAGRKAGRKKDVESQALQLQRVEQEELIAAAQRAEGEVVQVEDVKVEEAEVDMESP